MHSVKDRQEAFRILSRSFSPRDQTAARAFLDREGSDYRAQIFGLYLDNPFLTLTDDELAEIDAASGPMDRLISAREAAARAQAPRHVVFCMPKSGSSFIQSALQHALQLPFVSLTGYGSGPAGSDFGMNGREQELDELALVKSSLLCPRGFVAQHHTRYTPYLALQLRRYGVAPIVTTRNIPDCIVSFDDMMIQWRKRAGRIRWISDAPFALPLDYETLDAEARYTILTHSFGVWLVNFHVSWTRGRAQGLVSPLVLRYEDHVLDPDALVGVLSQALRMSEDQRQRLRAYVQAPDRVSARFNVGRAGRGAEQVPAHLRAFLAEYAALFRGDLGEDDLAYLVG